VKRRTGSWWIFLCVFGGAILIATVARAQFATPTGKFAGTAGASCAGLGKQFAWPDANGHVLQCISNVWTAVTQSGTPASPTGSVQFNNAGALGGSANLFWNNSSNFLGIGTNAPANALDVNGGVAVGSYAGVNAAPTSGLIVSGNVGIGSTAPIANLDINGSLSVGNSTGNTTTTINGTINATVTTIAVVSTVNYPSVGAFSIGGSTEVMTYTGKTATTFTGVTRGAYGTTATSHTSGAIVYGMVLQVQPGNIGGLYTSAMTVFNNASMIIGTPQQPYSIAGPGIAIGTNVSLGATGNGGYLAIGSSAAANGQFSTAIGTNVTTAALEAIALGFNTTAAAVDEMVIGEYNLATGHEGTFSTTSSTNPLFVVGIGTSGQSANALIIFDDGQMLVNGGTTVAIPVGTASMTVMGTTNDSTAASINATNSSGTSRLYVRNDGNVGISNTAPASLLHVGSASASGIVAEFQNSSGACTLQPSSSAMTTTCSSDIRLKTDVSDTDEMLPWIGRIRVRDFTVRATGERKTGVIAQELLITDPDMVHMTPDGFYAVDAPNPWKLVKAVQELNSLNDNLETEIGDLTAANDSDAAEIKALRERLEALEAGQ
jgi:hypothetical protein